MPNICVIDLEHNKPSDKVIEIGWTIGRMEEDEVLFIGDCIVNPEEPLDPFISQLTTITQDQVDRGIPFKEAFITLCEFYKKYDCTFGLCQWGGGDMWALIKQAKSENITEHPFANSYINVKSLYQCFAISRGLKAKTGLLKSCQMLKHKFIGTPHRAIDDALNTYHLFRAIMKEFKAG